MGAAVGGIAIEAGAGDGGDADFGDEIFGEGHVVGKPKAEMSVMM